CRVTGPTATQAPRSVRAPALRGSPVVGHVLRCLAGAWSGSLPMVFSYRWLRGARILARDHRNTRRLLPADGGKRVACRVWAGNSSGVSQATSATLLVRPRR